jgi:asparagine synthase (glutamine-hydrolysing)
MTRSASQGIATPRPAFRGRFDPTHGLAPEPPPAGTRSIVRPGLEIIYDPARASAAEDQATVCVAVGAEAASCLARYRTHGKTFAEHLRGRFAVAIVEPAQRRAVLAVDRFAIAPLCYATAGGGIAFADRADAVPLDGAPAIDPQALYEYLRFHVIPAPRTVFRDVARLRAGHAVEFANGRATITRYWQPRFEESRHEPLETLTSAFRRLVEAAVRREAEGKRAGAFLSGGTDSSTVAGMLGRALGRPAPTFSIGFDAAGYDEMAYARVAARHFGTDHHERYVTPDDLVAGIPAVATWFDQPFGNSSAVPAYYCARFARETGLDALLAGDGGDELFGGNARYATQRVFEAYACVPGALRSALIEPILLGVPRLDKLPLVRKAASYVRQAKVPMPDRLDAYNLLERLGVGDVLTPELLSAIDADAPRAAQRAVWAEAGAGSLVNRMLAYDWKYTLADNDLPKVCGATALAGIRVAFPLLDDELVDFSLRLAPALKLKGLKLRWFFKEALRGFLPDEILAKKKHGFGLPFGVWLAEHAGLQALARESFAGLRARGIVRAAFLDDLLDRRLAQHPGYYGEMVWLLVVLEQWLAARAPGFALED